MNNYITINQLLTACEYQAKIGNGDKHIFISSDDEGNGFHGLFYTFIYDKQNIDDCLEYAYIDDGIDRDKIVLLG